MIFFSRDRIRPPTEGSHSWSSARDSKSRKPQGFESSNLSPSARTISYRATHLPLVCEATDRDVSKHKNGLKPFLCCKVSILLVTNFLDGTFDHSAYRALSEYTPSRPYRGAAQATAHMADEAAAHAPVSHQASRCPNCPFRPAMSPLKCRSALSPPAQPFF